MRNYLMSIISVTLTVILGLVSDNVLHLSSANTYLVLSTGAVISLALGLIEQRLNSHQRQIKELITGEMAERLNLLQMVDRIDDAGLKEEVFTLARRLSVGEIPFHIATVRVPELYERAAKTIYASNVSLTREKLYRWDELARFRRIIETSARRSAEGVKISRTFFLTREQVRLPDGRWEQRSHQVLTAQVAAKIDVRIVWSEDLDVDNLPPHRRLVRDMTIFDDLEAVDTTGVQVIYRHPSDRLREFIDIAHEQLKYSESFDRYVDAQVAPVSEFP